MLYIPSHLHPLLAESRRDDATINSSGNQRRMVLAASRESFCILLLLARPDCVWEREIGTYVQRISRTLSALEQKTSLNWFFVYSRVATQQTELYFGPRLMYYHS